MTSMYPEGYVPPPEIKYGEHYDGLMATRKSLMTAKSALKGFCPPHE